MTTTNFTNRQKAAILLIALDARSPGISQQLFSKMGENQSKLLLHEINLLGKIDNEQINNIINEFHALAITQDNLLGGKNLTDKLLKESFGIEDSDGYFTTKKGLLDFTETLSDKILLDFLQQENEQTIALILSLLPDERSAVLLTQFDTKKTATITKKMISIDIPNFNLIWKFHRALEIHLLGDTSETIKESQQIFKLSRVLEMMVTERRDEVISMIKKQDKTSAEKIEKLIFSFTDLSLMSTKDLGILLVEIEPLKTLAQAMQDISAPLETKLKDAISERMKARLDEALDQAENSSPQDIQDAQAAIVQLCRKLESEEKIAPLTKIIEAKELEGNTTTKQSNKKAPQETKTL